MAKPLAERLVLGAWAMPSKADSETESDRLARYHYNWLHSGEPCKKIGPLSCPIFLYGVSPPAG